MPNIDYKAIIKQFEYQTGSSWTFHEFSYGADHLRTHCVNYFNSTFSYKGTVEDRVKKQALRRAERLVCDFIVGYNSSPTTPAPCRVVIENRAGHGNLGDGMMSPPTCPPAPSKVQQERNFPSSPYRESAVFQATQPQFPTYFFDRDTPIATSTTPKKATFVSKVITLVDGDSISDTGDYDMYGYVYLFRRESQKSNFKRQYFYTVETASQDVYGIAASMIVAYPAVVEFAKANGISHIQIATRLRIFESVKEIYESAEESGMTASIV